jgi:phage terminase large subunit
MTGNKHYFHTTRVYQEIEAGMHDDSILLIDSQGGTSSSKTYSAVQWFCLNYLFYGLDGLTSFVSESFPHLKRGVMRDFVEVMGPYYDDNRYNRTDHIYEFNKGRIEFFGADSHDKLRGPRREYLYLNEANNVSYFAFDNLYTRTKRKTLIDYNPTAEFWVHEKGLKGDPATHSIKSTYLDARHLLPKQTIEKIEWKKERDPDWWRVYGLGELGKIDGLVHPNFSTCDQLPEGGVRFYGLDFGFSNDPTALVHCVVKGLDIFSDEVIYEKGLLNSQIIKRLQDAGVRKHYDEIYADSAEPKTIAEILAHGYNIKPAAKGPDSVRASIAKVNEYNHVWTKRSLNGIKEQRNYRYIVDNQGKITEKPIDDYDHLMNARWYAVMGKLDNKQAKQFNQHFV